VIFVVTESGYGARANAIFANSHCSNFSLCFHLQNPTKKFQSFIWFETCAPSISSSPSFSSIGLLLQRVFFPFPMFNRHVQIYRSLFQTNGLGWSQTPSPNWSASLSGFSYHTEKMYLFWKILLSAQLGACPFCYTLSESNLKSSMLIN